MQIVCIGMNHKTAGVELREKLSFDPGQMRRALGELARRWAEAEFLLFSTCNRTELYAAGVDPAGELGPRTEELSGFLGHFHGLDASDYAGSLYTLADADAAEHLFAVAGGLDSLVPGEAQIVAQIKDAYAAAVEAGTAGAVLNELVQTALHVAKHVRSETGIGQGKVSVASVAVECVSQVFEPLDDKCVLNVGAGKMNELMLKRLAELRARRIVVANRSPEKAEQLARACGGEVADFAAIGEQVAAADVIVTSTGSGRPIITAGMVAAAQDRRNWRPLLIVDIAVPRDVEPEAGGLDNVFLYNIDDLDRIVRASISLRQAQREKAEGIVARHVGEAMEAVSVRDVAPTIEALYRRMSEIAGEELQAARNKLSTHDDAEADAEIIRRALHRTIRRILHPAASNLRRAAASDAEVAKHIAALRKLFELD